ncbi:MAG: PTS transporter subunit EIIA [Planctomycetes bacterium]|jgi:PTS system nitrogen regulatory IIA component|nr:PTS transporter subunit EIIA [Planctomycetota bacterium]
MNTDKPEIMTVAEVAEFLRVSERTVYDWAVSGTIPCGKLGTTWRFKRSEVQKWVDDNLSGSRKPISFTPISIADILSPQHVLIISETQKDAALLRTIDHLAKTGAIDDKQAVQEGIFQRERLMSTGIGLGVGIPHIRQKGIDDLMMAVTLSTEGIVDYETLDNVPVRLIFMILAGQHQHTLHIKTMAAISSRIRNPVLREMLLQADNPETLYQLLT